MPAAGERVMHGSSSYFAVEMKKLLNDKDSSDVKFIIGSSRKPFYAHRCLVTVRCDAFKAMLTEARHHQQQLQRAVSPAPRASGGYSSAASDVSPILSPMPPSASSMMDLASGGGGLAVTLILPETNPETFSAVLEYLYTNCVSLKQSSALDVLAASVEFGLDDLRRLCFDYLTENLNSDNACELLQAAVTFGQEDLRIKTTEFIERNGASVFKTKAFTNLTAEALAGILSSDQLMLDELDIVSALRSWANLAVESSAGSGGGGGGSAGCAARRGSSSVDSEDCPGLQAAVRELRLGLLTPQELAEVERENARDALIPVSMFAEAWKLHALKQVSDRSHPMTRPRKGTLRRAHLLSLGPTAGDDECCFAASSIAAPMPPTSSRGQLPQHQPQASSSGHGSPSATAAALGRKTPTVLVP